MTQTTQRSALIATLLGIALLQGCAHRTGASTSAPRPHASHASPGHPHDRIGRIYHYLRSNQDGSEREWVSVYRKDATHIEVYKMRARCTNAALVAAELDLARGQARRLLGGRLQPGNRRDFFAVMDYEAATRTIDATVRLPDRVLHDTATVAFEPWHLYDFDLASMTVTLPRRADWRAAFSFSLPLVLVGGDPEDFLADLGRADARYVREELHDGRPALRFEVSGPALGDKGGPLWLDRDAGHVLEARWGVPNHSEYRDFQLRLLAVDDGGEAAWDRQLRAHFEGCPRQG